MVKQMSQPNCISALLVYQASVLQPGLHHLEQAPLTQKKKKKKKTFWREMRWLADLTQGQMPRRHRSLLASAGKHSHCLIRD